MSTIDKLRSLRIGPFSVFDTVGTIGIGYAWHKITNTPLMSSLVLAFVTGELTHILVDVETPGTKLLEEAI